MIEKKVGKGEVAFKVTHCGVCHSDVHQARNDWGNTNYPCVPGHEVVGTVTAIGEGVSKVKVGDIVGVGCMIDSCQKCEYCEADEENYCQGEKGATMTYNGPMIPNGTNTYGGYTTDLIAREEFILKVPGKLEPEYAGPIMCAGITVYSPMRHWDLKEGQTLGVAGIGGLGHMAIQIGKALGAKVTAFTRDADKEEELLEMGADKVVISKDDGQMKQAAGSLDMLINTIPVPHDLEPYINLMKPDGNIVIVGNLVKFPEFSPASLVFKRLSIVGSLIGGIKQTQEILDLCAEKDIRPAIKMIDIKDINEVFENLANGTTEGHFRHVIDMETLRNHEAVRNEDSEKIEDPIRA
ncbi:NAD(P)-dependent alcohol dehydrogenase [Luteolibacter algae]|uniref:NAD(P)-dependent alcohol dehydrogenase n=1 Tax=Luteolibacter algae TaxID=454151 RepID=A0ABW5D884_9BACT